MTVAVSRRSVLRGVGVGAAVLAAGLVDLPATTATATTLSDDFTTARDGSLDGRIAPSGHRWRTYGSDGGRAMTIADRALGPPAGLTDGTPVTAGYASVDMGGPVIRVAAEYHWDPSLSSNTGLALGAFTWGPDDRIANPAIPATAGGSPMHLAITPSLVEFAVFSQGVRTFTLLTPFGTTSSTYALRTPQVRDGRTSYLADISLSGSIATVSITGLPPLRYQDPRIASIPAHWPFFEYYSTPGGTDLPRVTRVAAQRR